MSNTPQYDSIAQAYSKLFIKHNELSISAYFRQFDFLLENKKLIDLGCGDGTDLCVFTSAGVIPFGIDASQEMVKIAQQKNPAASIKKASFEKIPFEDSFFDIVVSKWALQTSMMMASIYKEVFRILKPDGYFIFLVTHPLRHFMEKRNDPKNYFIKEIVDSHLFERTLSVKEPSHTLEEYLSPFFLNHFSLLQFEEGIDHGAEKIGGHVYPAYFILKVQKKFMAEQP